ncbi:quinol:cytochrome c oxidoreductase monoheme cytochrome subunit [Chthonomonas calidirosea]|uniref:Quinol:cytochrome c oxidoreductase monoheme cytochrome subunit n=1 Tax=Chthonomonas calidirosea (strain DSM 23976 / ICMP 18418 / T49) TaxID=1303518 RepID=S0ESU4_CHTCT|nr:cytochrome c [Chthonomonas calidirosea]CCW34055.1 quinol:cytochrome c oxidoreductase monoheme cytochrome subunit [Chthonomonas calidirosea T49]CEK14756.1 quinol:cytochrome c oxidoreductase monoheme cytochrome subunit [Chthonomonas calidirosea]CEK15882.1 quinol:cytochrome c oxidoreductase monoheme cytochrome subunit [Chthonomonas calidirosea]
MSLVQWRKRGWLPLAAMALWLLAGCHQDMWDQPKADDYSPSEVFPDGATMRPLPAHTVDRTHFWTDEGRYTGYVGTHYVGNKLVMGRLVTRFPFKITYEDLKRGQELYNIYCSPCHGALGNGMGMIAMRGLALRRPPATYHTDRLRKMPIGHFYDVITNGYGTMFSYASRIEPDDRWRIVAYIRVLQRSQDAKPSDLPPGVDINQLPLIHTTGDTGPAWHNITYTAPYISISSTENGGPMSTNQEGSEK